MRKLVLTIACATALAATPAMTGGDQAQASGKGWAAFLGGLAAGAIITNIVQAGQSHCHEGIGCHSHGYAGPGHWHEVYGGPILYAQQPAYAAPPPPPVAAGYPQQHYQWCANKYRSYDVASNTFQPFGPNPRRPCISPFVQ